MVDTANRENTIIDTEDFFQSNIKLLEKYHYDTFKYLEELKKSEGMHTKNYEPEIFYTSEGKINLKVKLANGKTVYLHDQNDPEKEITQFLNMIPENANGVVLLTGMGLCYTPMAILEKRKNIQYLALFDPEPYIFLHILHYIDLSPMLSDPRVILSIKPDPDIDKILKPALLALQLENIYNLKHIPSFSIDNDKYTNLSDSVFTIANQFNLGGGAILGGGLTYTINRFKNLTSMYKNSMVENLKDKFKDIPAILVAGGPSLNLNVHLLQQIKGKSVIIAVDSTLPVLVANGVSPDFLTAIDPYDLIYEKFADALPETHGTSLITSAWVAPKVTKAFPSLEIFWTFSGRNMENWMQEMMGGSIPTGGAATVAHLNLVAAILMGCSPIVFIGQDLAYTGGASHAENTVLTQNQAMKNLLKSKDLIWTEEISGGKVPTDRKFLNFKRHFEDLISNNPGIYINSTVQGAKIEGTEAIPLEDVIEKYCSGKKRIPEIIASSISRNKNSDKFIKEFRSFIRKSNTLMKIIARSDILHETAIKGLTKYKTQNTKHKSFQSLPGELRNIINEIDGLHKKIDGYKKIWGILDEVTMQGLKISERQKHAIEKLKNDSEKYIDWLLKNFERLIHINKVRKDGLKTFETNLSKLIRHFEKEKKILKSLGRYKYDNNHKLKTNQIDQLIELAQLYFETKDFSLLGNVCNEFENIYKQNSNQSDKVSKDKLAIIYFYSGCVLLLRNNFDEAEKYFKRAIDTFPDIKQRVNEFRQKLGDEYIGHADFFNGKDDDTIRRMLIKGMKYSGGHTLLEHRLHEMSDMILKYANKSLDEFDAQVSSGAGEAKASDNPNEIKKYDLLRDVHKKLEKWINDIEKHKILKNILTNEKISEFYRLNGTSYIKENKFKKAVDNFNKAISLIPNNPQYHLMKADACFAIGDYDNGIIALNNAVAIDVEYAQYWENMGDNLAKQGKFNDAIAAYEQFFTASPKNKMVLKKISQCFIELGQLDAAKNILVQLKNLC